MAKMKDWTGNKRSTFIQLGASNHTEKEREINDYYATDPMGSGSTMVACVNTGRKGVGIELMQEYYDIAVKRVKDATAQLKLDF